MICIRENILGPEAHKIMVGEIRKAIHAAVFEERELREKLSYARAAQLTRDILGPAPEQGWFKVVVEFDNMLNHAMLPPDVVLHTKDRWTAVGTVVLKMLDDMVALKAKRQ